eukprot:SM000428S16065  [mRNA]  locus=s428:25901:29213:+ [translate_table: standard]
MRVSLTAGRGGTGASGAGPAVTGLIRQERVDGEVAAGLLNRLIFDEVAVAPLPPGAPAKLAFLYLVVGEIPYERLWARYFENHEDYYTVYVHASLKGFDYVKGETVETDLFVGRKIPSGNVTWCRMDMVDAERRLLAQALQDPGNRWFILISESCIPIRSFEYAYRYITGSDSSFIESFEAFGRGFPDGLESFVPKDDFRKGSQWWCLQRHHAMAIIADYYYYRAFRVYCRSEVYCCADEHYVQNILAILDAPHVSNYSATFVEWPPHRQAFHPFHYYANNTNGDVIQQMQASISLPTCKTSRPGPCSFKEDEVVDVKSASFSFELFPCSQSCSYSVDYEDHKVPCVYNGRTNVSCFMFARKFSRNALDVVMALPEDVLGY